jgi:hypothetical protein
MTDLFKAYETNADAEKTGVPIHPDFAPEITFMVARAGGANESFAKEGEKRFRPYRRAIEQGGLDNKIATKLAMELFIDTQLKGWEGISEDGVEYPYTRDNAVKLFTRLPELHIELQRKAQSMATFQRRDLDDDAKN